MMEKERDEYFTELEKLNKLLTPQNFIKYKKEIEDKYNCLNVLDSEDIEKELEKYKIRLQKVFLDMLKSNINKAETKQEIEKIIYSFRYYLLLPYNYKNTVQNIQKLQNQIDEVRTALIDKAISLKVLQNISLDKETNYEILKNIFSVRIIKLEDAYLKITKEKDKYFLQIFDENIFEEKIEISKPKELEIKLNKKISIWG